MFVSAKNEVRAALLGYTKWGDMKNPNQGFANRT